MNAVITTPDESSTATRVGYRYDRVVEIGGRVLRACVIRALHVDCSLAYVEALTDQNSGVLLTKESARTWWRDTPEPHEYLDAAAALGPVADRLLRRAATMPIPAPTPRSLSPRAFDAVSALLATSLGYNGECRITPDDITWANTYGGKLHIIELPDGDLLLTKAHDDQCPFFTSAGTQPCEGEIGGNCDLAHPVEARRQETADAHSIPSTGLEHNAIDPPGQPPGALAHDSSATASDFASVGP